MTNPATSLGLCYNGHDLSQPGSVTPSGRCIHCRREADKRRKKALLANKRTCAHGHPLVPGNVTVSKRRSSLGNMVSYRVCLTCRNSRRKESKNEHAGRQAAIAQIIEEILSLADRQDTAGGPERREIRERVAELTRQKDLLERKGERRVAMEELQ